MRMSGLAYKASAGETFDSIAKNVYGDVAYTADLMAANPEICRKNVMTGGEKVYLPIVTEQNVDGLPKTAPWKE